MEAWWERYPDARAAEEAALNAWGHPWSLDQAELARQRYVVRVRAPVGGTQRELVALYPDSFPYFAPAVRLDSLRIPRHQNPDGFLCLLADDAEDWRPGMDTLAGILQTQLPRIEQANDPGTSTEAMAQIEQHAGEPLSNFLPYLERCAILVPDEAPPAEISWGRLELLGKARPDAGLSAVLTRVSDPTGRPLVEFRVRLPSLRDQFGGFWLRLAQRPPVQGDTTVLRQQLFEIARTSCDAFRKRLDSARAGEVLVVGFIYPDEVRWRESAEDWVFLWVRVARPRRGMRDPEVHFGFVSADPAGDQALAMRAPELFRLRSQSVLLVGVGAIGSPVAIQLARSGIGKLDLVDFDHLQVGNSVRWALGWSMAGHPKTEVLAAHISADYPRTVVVPHTFSIGARWNLPDGTPFSDYDFLRERMADSSLVLDATASYRVNHLLADIARRESRPYLWLSTTPGAAGGVVGRILPGKTQGCWHCFQLHLADRSVPLPADNGAALVQPGGCVHPTFVAAGVDSDEVSVLASRLAVATLSRDPASAGDGAQTGADDSAPKDFEWDVAVGDLVEGPHRIAGRWSGHPLQIHPRCQHCAPQT